MGFDLFLCAAFFGIRLSGNLPHRAAFFITHLPVSAAGVGTLRVRVVFFRAVLSGNFRGCWLFPRRAAFFGSLPYAHVDFGGLSDFFAFFRICRARLIFQAPLFPSAATDSPRLFGFSHLHRSRHNHQKFAVPARIFPPPLLHSTAAGLPRLFGFYHTAVPAITTGNLPCLFGFSHLHRFPHSYGFAASAQIFPPPSFPPQPPRICRACSDFSVPPAPLRAKFLNPIDFSAIMWDNIDVIFSERQIHG